VDRDPARLEVAAARVQADLRRTTGHPWRLTVSTDLVLTIADDRQIAQVQLDAEVDDVLLEGVTSDSLADELDIDADDAVAYQVSEGLIDLGVTWPLCPDHRRAMSVCSGLWFCEGEPYHDVADVGSLVAG
jgi:hypothetical protein